MAHNGKPSSHKVNSQDYMNLLYSDSDSDRIPDLKLPPLKGKKQKRKKGFSGRHDDGTCNHVYRALKVGVVIIVFVTLTCLAGVAIWSLQRIKELQDQVESCK